MIFFLVLCGNTCSLDAGAVEVNRPRRRKLLRTDTDVTGRDRQGVSDSFLTYTEFDGGSRTP